MSPKPPMPSGRHQWNSQFRFPSKSKHLPPSFGHAASMPQTLQVGYSNEQVQASCSVLYSLTAHVKGTDLPVGFPKTAEGPELFFWPNRYTELPDGPLPTAHRQSISIPRVLPRVPFQKDERKIMQKLRKKVFRSQDLSKMGFIVYIPRYNILGEPLQVRIILSPGNESLELPALTLRRAQYELLAVTRIGRSSSSGQHKSTRTAVLRQQRSLNVPFPGDGSALHLHKVAPVILPISPNWTRPTGVRTELLGPLCPSFESALMARTYTLTISIHVSCTGELQCRHFAGGELILLPPKLDSSVKKAPVQLMGKAIVEADGGTMNKPELAGDHRGGSSRIEIDGGETAAEMGSGNPPKNDHDLCCE